MSIGGATWYGVEVDRARRPSLAGWWLGCVSLPLFRFLLLRWYFRLLIWLRFLWQVSRIDLDLVPTHPERCCGPGLLALMPQAFSPVLLALGAVLAGVMANRIFHANVELLALRLELIGLVSLMEFAILGPSLVFSPSLAAARRSGLLEYGALARRCVAEFDHKWLRGGAPPGEPLIGSADVQSLADIASSFELVEGMSWVPFTSRTVLQLASITLLPVALLLLTMIPLEELLDRVIKIDL